jgi:hypothetical protein
MLRKETQLLLFGILLFAKTVSAQLTVPFTESFTTGLNGWKVNNVSPHDFKWYANEGVDGLGGLRAKLPTDSNYIASPGIYLEAGVTYTVFFKSRLQQNNSSRKQIVGINNVRKPAGMTTIDSRYLPTNSYATPPFVEYSPNFTVPTTGTYYLIFTYEENGYFYYYFDEVGVELMQAPSINLISPIEGGSMNENYTDSTKISFAAAAADIDGVVDSVEYFANGVKIGTSRTAPYNLTLKDVLPKQYTFTAKATDNRGNTTTSAPINYTVNFRDGSLSPYVQWDFNANNTIGKNLEYWSFANGDYRTRPGFHGSNCLELFSLNTAANYAASPGIQLTAGLSYSFETLVDAGGSKPVRILLSKTPSLVDTVLIDTIKLNGNEKFAHVRTKTFTVSTNGVYHIVLNYAQSTAFPANYLQLKFDNLRVIGSSLNIAPYANFTNPTANTTTAQNAFINLKANVLDVDGSISKVEYYANSIKVGESSTAPYVVVWNNVPLGNHEITARPIDNQGAQGVSTKINVNAVANVLKTSGFIGSADNDEVRAVVIKENNEIVLAGNFGVINSGSAPVYYLNGATASSLGAIVVLKSDGQSILSVTRLATSIADMAKDENDYLYVAAPAAGAFKLSPSANNIIWQKTYAKPVHRIDAAKKGKAVVMLANESDVDDGTLTGCSMYIYDEAGNQLASMSSVAQYGADVAIDDVSETVIAVGFKNYDTYDGSANSQLLPVYVPVMRGYAFNGNIKYTAYDWDKDTLSPRWLNRSANNMADARLNRCTIGKDGKLYAAGQTYGGNHCFRWDPFDIMLSTPQAGGDNFHTMANTSTVTHVFFGRYEPGTGNVLKSNNLTARLDNGKDNSIFIQNGNIDADETGRVLLTGLSAFGFPLAIDHMPGLYRGGAYVLMMNADMNQRIYSSRLLADGANGRAVYVKNSEQWIVAGSTTTTNIYLTAPLQSTKNAGADGWLAVTNNASCALPTAINGITAANNNTTQLAAAQFYTDNNCQPYAKIVATGSNPVLGLAKGQVWIESNGVLSNYVKRHIELTPVNQDGTVSTNANNFTGRVTIYFTQAEFDVFNNTNTTKLPVDAADINGIANLQVTKFAGTSNNGTGLPNSYTNGSTIINPVDTDIIWNAAENRWEISFEVVGFSGFFVGATPVTLPLKLLSFNAQKTGTQKAFLTWQTSNEVNTQAFVVEKSVDGQTFAIMDQLAAIGSGNNDYQLTDNQMVATQNFYRLKMVDRDGRFTYSPTVLLLNNKMLVNISLPYPNPVISQRFMLSVASDIKTSLQMQLLDVKGRMVWSKQQQLDLGNTNLNIQLPAIRSGNYLLRMIDAKGNTSSYKLMID